ncbi:hypothetical protein [Geminocystis sp. NIES-3709]|uniref:hypothetical protein n=1 Tax=Geminocystis sp. NIES-3709 TaxID=1617448 RepID=UPI0005FC6E84|nr:hypothetical protein [Geminocystis sp. NIES-3709]BAQ63360.1 hypothetical protein GM3709_125 [Geminocystis sp. NIES-3709]
MSLLSCLYIICGGFHDSSLTTNFFTYLTTITKDISKENTIIFNLDSSEKIYSVDRTLPYNGFSIYKCLKENQHKLIDCDLIFMGFSAGVIGAIIAGNLWEKNGGKVKALFAFDSWGVPLIANFPCYRISHDYFTHLSYLGGETNSFYANPSISHLDLWQNPENVQGCWEITLGIKKRSNLQEFLKHYLKENRE